MNWWLNVLIGVLLLALIILVAVRVRLRRRLHSIDGLVGITTRGRYDGKVIGGEFTKVYKHNRTVG